MDDSAGAPTTDRLWITAPRRVTALARVVAVRGNEFALDRSLFAPTSRTHRHPQPPDTGTVWIQGEKRRLTRVHERGGLWHELRGTVPPVGSQVQCHLDVDRRQSVSRAHTAMHLFLAALQAEGAPSLAVNPTVKLGRTFRLDLTAAVAPTALAAVVRRVRGWVTDDRRVEALFIPRGAESQLLDAQSFHPPAPYPGPASTLSAVRIEDVCTYPCDGTHVERTGKIGDVAVASARAGRSGFVVVGKVA